MGLQIPVLGVKWKVHTLPKFSLVLVRIFLFVCLGFLFLFCLFVFAIYFFSIKLKNCVKIFCGKVSVCHNRIDFLSNMRRNMFLPCNGVPGAAAQLSSWFESLFIHISKEPVSVPLQNENKCQSSGTLISHFQVNTVHTVGLWQHKVVMTIYSSYRQCTAPSWEQPGSLVSLIN